MPTNFWDADPVLRQDASGAFWQTDPIITQDLSTMVDKRTGAPVNVRAAVGAASTPEDRLSTLRQFYPDAKPYGDDNFVFNDPRHGGRPTLYNEENRKLLGMPLPSVGDIISVGPEIAEAIGGAGGVAAAGLAAPVSGGTSLLTTPAAAGLGAAAGREGYNVLAQMLLGTKDTRSLPQHLADTAITTGVNAVGQRAGELVGKGIDAIAGVANRYLRNPAMAPGRAALEDFANAGVQPPTPGAVTGNRSLQIVENALSNTPGGSSVMQEAADRSLSQVRGEADDLARRIATADGANPAGAVRTPQGVGETIRNAADAAGQRFNARVTEELGPAVDRAVGADTRVPVANVNSLIREFEAAIREAPETAGPQLSDALDELRAVAADAAGRRTEAPVGATFERAGHHGGQWVGGLVDEFGKPLMRVTEDRPAGIPFRALRQARTALGQMLDNPDVSGYSPRSQAALRRAYDVLREDIYAAARAAGPDAERALATHDRYVRFNRNVNLPVLQKIADQQTDEQAFKYAMGLSKDGGSRLFSLRRNSRPEEWDVVASSVFSRLGRATPGQQGATDLAEEAGDFSINTFLTNWNRLAPEARRALFSGTRYSQIVPEMENLARVADRMRDAQKMANPSGTARNLLAAAGIGAAANEAFINKDPYGAAGMLATGVIAPRVAAKLLTNPRTIRWLADGARVSLDNPNAVTAHLARLTAIAEAEPGLRDAVSQFVESLRPATAQPSTATGPGR